jgi:hypothetical protein
MKHAMLIDKLLMVKPTGAGGSARTASNKHPREWDMQLA